VEFFVSYYDYYQPEAYLPTTDTYIEKDSSINDEIDRLRTPRPRRCCCETSHRVASVSCIYGLGSPSEYRTGSSASRSARNTTSGPCCAGSSTCSTTATT